MFSKFRTGAKKAAHRSSRHDTHDEDSSAASSRRNGNILGFHGNRSVDVLSSTNNPRASVVPSLAPILPPIPRIASKASQHGGHETASHLQSTSQSINTQKTLADRSSPLSDDSVSAQDQDQELLHPVRTMDEVKAHLQADKTRMDAHLMPPPPRPSMRSNTSDGGLRSRMEYFQRPASARTEKTSSSKGSSNFDIPSTYRLQEPEEWVTPPQAIQLGPQPPPRPKSRLTKLNPLSYLSRKKSSQSPIDEIDNNVIAKRASFMPAQPLHRDFDPRIKGKVIHDFSSPRPSHFVSHQNLRSAAADHAVELPPSGIYDARRGSDSNLPKRTLGDSFPERKHESVFKEDFGTSAEGWRLDPEDRRNQTSSDIVDKVAALEKAAKDEKRKSSLPAFAVHMPEDLPAPRQGYSTPTASKVTPKLTPEPEPEPELAMTPNSFNSIQQTPDSLKPPKHTPRQDPMTPSPQGSPLAERSRATSPDAPQAFSSLPKHLRSKTASIRSQASRFSFDMAPTGSAAQEKLLEERHRQRAAQRARATSLTSISINEEDGFDDEDIDFDEGMEEEIPGMNDDDYGYGGKGGVANMTLDAEAQDNGEEIPGLNDESDDNDEFGTDDIAAGGLGDMTLETFQSQEQSSNDAETLDRSGGSQTIGLGLENTTLETDTGSVAKSAANPGPTSATDSRTISSYTTRADNRTNESSNNDFYFDDGEFDGEFGSELDDADLASHADDFDESLLDQDLPRGKHIESLKPLPTENPGTMGSSLPSTRPDSVDSEALTGKRRSELTADTSRNSLQFGHARRSSAYGQHDEFDAAAGLTQENLSAYHNALAFAANKAASQGRFDRKSVTEESGSQSSPEEPPRQRNVSFNAPRTSFNRPSLPVQSLTDNEIDDDFNFDDDLDDEAIIAAANAEALENDDDNFYGSEFGFYASSYGSGEAQAFHGGYFGPAGLNQVKRSHSGREAFQEPSLTPITERSEWSNRNSMISVAMQGSGISPGVAAPGGLPLSSPGLAQLADQLQYEGGADDMSLSALMKTRRGVFGGGGSSTSLHSMGNPGPSSRSGSPSLYAFQQQQGISPLSNHDIAPPPPLSEDREEFEEPRRASINSMQNPMLTLQTQNLTLRPTTSGSDQSPMKKMTPPVVSTGRGGRGHSRTSSGADSVSYVMQIGDDGDEKWVVEKRRTLDNGDVEILDRNIVHGTL